MNHSLNRSILLKNIDYDNSFCFTNYKMFNYTNVSKQSFDFFSNFNQNSFFGHDKIFYSQMIYILLLFTLMGMMLGQLG